MKIFALTVLLGAASLCSGCVVVTVAGAAVSVASTAVSAGVTVGSAALSVAGSAVKGVANIGSGAVETVPE